MAEGKKSFLLYVDLIHTVDKMTDKQAGLLFKHILQYVNDLNPVTDNIITQISFEPIKQGLKRDLEKWEKIKERNSENGKKGGRRTSEKNPKEPKEPSGLSGFPKEPKQAVSVSVNVSDNVIVSSKEDVVNTTATTTMENEDLEKEQKINWVNPDQIWKPPTIEEVQYAFKQKVFPEELSLKMASAFFIKHEAASWLDGNKRELRKWQVFIPKFIENWDLVESKNKLNGNFKANNGQHSNSAAKIEAIGNLR